MFISPGPTTSATFQPSTAGASALNTEKQPVSASETENTGKKNESRQSDETQRRQIAELAKTDREVRAHEQAHASVGGVHAGAASFTYQRGPDGRLYASGGEVPIDTSPVPGDPQATLDKALIVKRAALAPAEPSAADRRIAAKAAAIATQARIELALEQRRETNDPAQPGSILDLQA